MHIFAADFRFVVNLWRSLMCVYKKSTTDGSKWSLCVYRCVVTVISVGRSVGTGCQSRRDDISRWRRLRTGGPRRGLVAAELTGPDWTVRRPSQTSLQLRRSTDHSPLASTLNWRLTAAAPRNAGEPVLSNGHAPNCIVCGRNGALNSETKTKSETQKKNTQTKTHTHTARRRCYSYVLSLIDN